MQPLQNEYLRGYSNGEHQMSYDGKSRDGINHSIDDLAQVEQSLAQIYRNNMTLMAQSLEQYKNELTIFQKKYDMLREDYQYNLRVIQERDDALKKYDSRVTKLSQVACFIEEIWNRP